MRIIAAIVRAICGFNGFLGRIFSWFSLGIVLVCFVVVTLRYVFHLGAVPLQDLYVWLNGMMFMGIAGYTLMRDGHVRVDVFYRDAPTRRRALVDMVGAVVFVAPFLVVLTVWSLPYVERSWALREGSANVGGLPGLYILKSFVLVFVAVIGLQALAMFLRGVLVLAGSEELLPDRLRYSGGEG
ncbi:MAG TPA: TRAP transporter small permease subunit [Amaricoccus sp.]|uniref:TRAP transporter small permease subunit n=1 Tax=Amaricoccus sp. TaxID=1872485 RepID=UPI002C525349|nr:TRAP transporter small permease subunit [Amaricoccus sp.]HMQ93994.1 TRAP transporter small permease subunit [Amaricoccus sp.]HMR51992.1 TRAP transporter small permease subunit [Amaricoccus sp.]HMR60342.1 TRAP transporter small permease subunit [Amaricoccus sp.]HMT98794.1 TRAP transporter small permease subunit [Amaricoccus sp.]